LFFSALAERGTGIPPETNTCSLVPCISILIRSRPAAIPFLFRPCNRRQDHNPRKPCP
jgi:hypothetical protein